MDSKISEVRFVSSSGKDNLKFEYDAMGNRVAKYVMDGQTSFAKHVTYYVRDASGNVMAVYEHDLETPESYHLAERHIYGSSRLGMITEKVEFEYVYGNLPTEELVSTLLIEETVNFELEYSVGKKQYELSNHLGNVLAVISDWKVPVISGASVVSYTTVVVSSQDYSPFGVTLSGRSWSAGYRYGFNGMEKDNETFSGAYDFGARILDVRLGRWMSVDKFVRLYNSNSGYCFALNSVITNTDVDGNVVQGDVNQFISDISAILCKIDGADIFVGLLEAQADINQVAQISEADFQTALAGLKDNPDAQALINGIYQIINSTMIYQIEYVNDKDNLALLVEEEESTFREDLLGKTGFDLRNGIANNYDKAQKEENSTGIIGKVVDISESVKKYYCIIHEDAVSTEFYFPSIGGDSKTIQAIPAYSMLNMLMTGFFKIDPFIRNQKGQDTQKPGYVVENLARGLTNEPLISNNGTALFYKIPWELEVDFKNKQSKKAKNKNKSNNDKRRNQPKGNKSSRHANPRFL